jgi:uncharacterized protein YprB with RNaseH-like and TPR domain
MKTSCPAEIPNILEDSRRALTTAPAFFTSRLATSEHWRIFPHFRGETAFLDIETTGLAESSEITTIAVYDGREIHVFVNGRNLEQFPEFIEPFRVLVTYNGRTFDIPFIERFFRIKLRQAQIDLRYVLARLGFKGGLKGCEKKMGIGRGELDGVDGYFAVLLWNEYEKYGDERALDTLLAYNIEDTVNLERLAVEAYNRNLAATPFAEELTLAVPSPPFLPYSPAPACIDRIRGRYRLT